MKGRNIRAVFNDRNLVLFGVAGFALALLDTLVFQKPFDLNKPYWPQFGLIGWIGHVIMISVLGWFVISRFIVAPIIIVMKKRK